MNNEKMLTKFQKDLISQVMHDELSAESPSESVVNISEKVDMIMSNIDRAMVMTLGMKQARES